MGPRARRRIYRRPWVVSGLLGCAIGASVVVLFLSEPGEGAGRGGGPAELWGRFLGFIGWSGEEQPEFGEGRDIVIIDADRGIVDVPGPEAAADGPPEVTFESETFISPGQLPAFPEEEPLPVGHDGAGFRGRTVDMRTGMPLEGVRVRGTLFHATAVPEGELLAVAGTPPLDGPGRGIVLSGEEGKFELESLLPEDPQALLHIQAERPGYSPVVAVLRARRGADGLWREVLELADLPRSVSLVTDELSEPARQRLDLRLRPSLTIPVRILDPEGRALAGAPVRVRAWKEGHAFLDEEVIGVAWNDRLVERGQEYVFFTDESGALRLPFHDTPYDLELLHPAYYLRHHDPLTRFFMQGRVTIVLPYSGELVLRSSAGVPSRHRLVDRDGYPVADAAIEVALAGMPPLRVSTDAGGRFEVGVMPFGLGEKPLGFTHPREGTITVLAPEYLHRSVAVSLPDPEEDILVAASAAKRLRFRLVERAGEEVTPVFPEWVVTSLDLVPVRLGRDGVVEFVGSLSRSEDSFSLLCRGCRPTTVQVPESGRALDREVDLGDIFLERGWEREVRLLSHGIPVTRGAELSLSPVDAPLLEQRYALSPGTPDGTNAAAQGLTVGGLDRGTYEIAVTGPSLRPYSGSFTIAETTLDEPLEIPLEWTPVEEVFVGGRVVDLAPHDAVRCAVVERYFLRGSIEPLTLPAYPLAPDGLFGSVRYLEDVTEVHVAVIGPGPWAADARARRTGRRPVFELGELRLGRRPMGDIRFEVEGLGTVAPPPAVSLEGVDGIESISRLRLGHHRLLADNLRKGLYTLRWRDRSGKEELFGFEVPSDFGGRLEGRARRSALEEELVEIRVVDSRGRPLEGAVASSARGIGDDAGEGAGDSASDPHQVAVIGAGAGLPPFLTAGGHVPRPDAESGSLPVEDVSTEPGVLLVRVTPRATSRFRVRRAGYLPATAVVAPGQPVPSQVTLYRPATIEGKVLDSDGQRVDGILEISWEPIEPTPVRHGVPVSVEVRRGRFEARGLVPVKRRFTFRVAGSDVAVRRHMVFPEEEEPHDIGVIRLEETRTLLGNVRLPDGLPARGATIALLPRRKAYRFPLRDPVDLARVAHRTTTNAQGGFRLEGLPIRPPADMVLVAHADGFGDAVEDPVAWDTPSRELFLDREALLELEVGYRSGGFAEDHRFTLEYREGPEPTDRVYELGEIAPDLWNFHRFTGVRPGRYRVKWGLRERYTPVPDLWEDVYLPPGGGARLSLRIEGESLRGRARLNGQAVKRGWILLTYDPGVRGGTRVGRVVDGEFLVIDPPGAFRVWAAVVPEAKPQPVQNIARGEALPVEVPNYKQALRKGYLEFDYAARSVTLRFAPSFFERHPGAELHFPHKEWNRGRYREYDDRESILEPMVHFHLLRPGVHRFSVRSPRGSLVVARSVALEAEDVVLDFR